MFNLYFFGLLKIRKHNKISFQSNNNDFQNKNDNFSLEYYENFINNIKIYNHSHIYSDNIYWCWLQGKDKAPKLYEATFNSVIENCLKHNIIVINKTNINNYVKFPSYIIEKYNEKILSNNSYNSDKLILLVFLFFILKV